MPIETGVSNILQTYVTQSQLAALAFLDLTDTPSTYAGAGGGFFYPRVNIAGNGLEFIRSAFLNLYDVPNTYAGQVGKFVRVAVGETALEFIDPSVIEFPGHLKPAIVRYLMPGWSIANIDTNITLTNGMIYYIPIFVTDSTHYAELAINVFQMGSAGCTIEMRLFTWNDGVPGAEIATLGTIATNVNGVRTLAIDITLPRGFYFLAGRITTVSTAAIYKCISWGEAVTPPVVGMASSNNPSVVNYTNSVVLTVVAAYADPAPAPDAMTATVLGILLKDG